MQKVKLPLTVKPIKAAQKRLDYTGYYSADQFSRLRDSVMHVTSDIQVVLSFTLDPLHLVVMTGSAKVNVELLCQRCDKPFDMAVECNFNYSPVLNENQAEQLPKEYEPIELNEFGKINLVEVIEDEILLALPLIPKHDFEHCEVSVAEQIFGEVPHNEEKESNPFAVLANLKKQK